MFTDKDKSEYLRGLLVLCRLDLNISNYEKKALIVIGKKLGFDSYFCSDILEELVGNPNVSEKPPIFSQKDISRAFIADGLKLALSDSNFELNELRWLRNTAKQNNIEKKYWLTQVNTYKTFQIKDLINFDFSLEKLLI